MLVQGISSRTIPFKMTEASKPGLREQKQEVVRDALYGAAIELFARKGFDETTVEELAQAAGVSRSTFFRHFESKDDLLSYPMLSYAAVLTEAVRMCPPGSSQLEVVQQTVLAGIAFILTGESRTKQVIDISSRSPAARQAYQSRMTELEDNLVHAYAIRFNSKATELRPRLLAGLTLTVMNTSLLSWFRGQEPDLRVVAMKAINELRSITTNTRPK